ncbi:hypothetical protein AbaMCR8676_17350 [Acinetobacter baumannii]|jgi:predicted RNA-binding Zn-ribbon protein involved in translation (DUF1610 family)|nr:hypothetical protein AbaMCR8676_17350 [Acinetobacter baumannii]PPC52903.1 hypothetical protein AbaMCR56_18060 [Acinetobacter baumannii]
MAKNIQTTYVRHGSKIKCPKCQSTNVKALKTQPKKFPKPTKSNTVDFNELMNFYDNGYSCNKCGNFFIAYYEDDYPLPKPSLIVRFLKFIFKSILYVTLICGFIYLWASSML